MGMDGGLWFGECECLDSHSERERERENQSDRQGHSFHASFTPNNNTPNEAVDACVKVIMVWRKGEGAYEGVIDWLRVHKCSR